MNSFFLKAKHWQMFSLIFVIPISLQATLVPWLVLNNYWTLALVTSLITVVLSTGTFYLWLWTIGTGLHHRLPIGVNMNLNFFKISLLYPVIYVSCLIICITLLVNQFMQGAALDSFIDPTSSILYVLIAVVVILHLTAIFCVFYTFWFSAKIIHAVRSNTPIGFSKILNEFFLLWFLPIGIWFIQPKINSIIKG